MTAARIPAAVLSTWTSNAAAGQPWCVRVRAGARVAAYTFATEAERDLFVAAPTLNLEPFVNPRGTKKAVALAERGNRS